MAAPHQQPASSCVSSRKYGLLSVEAACSGSNLYRFYHPLFFTAAGLGIKISERMSTKVRFWFCWFCWFIGVCWKQRSAYVGRSPCILHVPKPDPRHFANGIDCADIASHSNDLQTDRRAFLNDISLTIRVLRRGGVRVEGHVRWNMLQAH
jgi:hypothetical protein